MARLFSIIFGGIVVVGGAWAAAAARRSGRAAQVAQRQLSTLTAAVDGLARAAQPEDFLVGVLRAIAEQLDARWVLLFLHDPALDALAVRLVLKDGQILPREQATPNLVNPLSVRDVPLWAELERTRRPVHISDVRTDPRLRQRDALVAQGVRSMLVVPLSVGDRLIGWFSVRHTAARSYRPDELELAAALAQQAALAVQLSRLGAHSRQAAVLAERNRMAREIHDTLAQGFTGIIMQLEASESALDTGRPELARERLARAGQLARESLAEARRSVWALRPQLLEQQPFVEALRAAATAAIAGAQVQLAVDVDGSVGNLPAELEADLLRIVQEAAANSAKHAAARTIAVRLSDDGQSVELRVRDDGRGFVEPAAPRGDGGGFGLIGMRERIERHGGRLLVSSAPGQGTTILARVEHRRPGSSNAPPASEEPR